MRIYQLKKLVLFSKQMLILLVFVSGAAYGQTAHYVGVKAGVNFTNGYFRNQFFVRNMSTAPKQGINGMITYRYVMGKYAGLQLQAGYVEKGWRQVFEEIPAYNTYLNYGRLQFSSYFHLPLKNDKTQLYLTLGPYVDRLISNSADELPDFDYINANGITFFTYDEKRDFSIAYGITGELGFERKIGPGRVVVEGVLSVSLSRIIDSGQPDRNANEVIVDDRGNEVRIVLPTISSDFTFGVSFGYLIAFGKPKD